MDRACACTQGSQRHVLLECGFLPSPSQPGKIRTKLPVLESRKRKLSEDVASPGPHSWKMAHTHVSVTPGTPSLGEKR